jgi:hypothetical protein
VGSDDVVSGEVGGVRWAMVGGWCGVGSDDVVSSEVGGIEWSAVRW